MPSVSEKQRQFFAKELSKKLRGLRTQTGLNEKVLKDFAGSVVKQPADIRQRKRKERKQ